MNAEPRQAGWTTNLAACALVVLAGLLAYSNSFGGKFLFDDYRSIVENPDIRTFAGDASNAESFHRRLVGWWSFKLNYALGGLEVAGYHAVNLAVHLAAGLFLFGIVRRTLLLGPPDARSTRAAFPLALAVALIWVVHPLETQGVTYIVQRFESMMGMLSLACLYGVVRGSQSSRSWMWYTVAVAACWLGMFTKEVMIAVPLVVLLYDRVFLAETWREVFGRRWGMYVGLFSAALVLIAVVVWPTSAVAFQSAGFGYEHVTSAEYLGSQGGVILHYLQLAFWPGRLCLDYLWPVARSPLAIYPPCAAVAALLVASLVALRYYPRVGFLGVAFFLILAPTSSVMPIADLAVEHRMYLPLAPLVVLTVLGVFALAGRLLQVEQLRSGVQIALASVVVIALAWRTFDRNRDYLSRVAMWEDVVATSPQNPRAHNHLGEALANEGDLVGAADHFRLAIEISPQFAKAQNNMGVLLIQQKNFGKAKAYLERAIAIDESFSDAYYNLGIVLRRQGRLVEAAHAFERAIGNNPANADAYFSLAIALNKLGRTDEAAAQYRQAIRAKPDFVDAYNNLGNLLRRQGKLSEAIVQYEELLKINPYYAQAHVSLGTASVKRGEYHKAVKYFRDALKIEPDLSNAASNLTWVLAACEDASVRRAEEAIRWGERNAELTHQQDPAVLDALAAAYAEAGRWDEAVATASKAISLASSAGRESLARAIGGRRQLYQQRRPFRISSTGGQSH